MQSTVGQDKNWKYNNKQCKDVLPKAHHTKLKMGFRSKSVIVCTPTGWQFLFKDIDRYNVDEVQREDKMALYPLDFCFILKKKKKKIIQHHSKVWF